MLKLVMHVLMCLILLIVAKVNCGWKAATPSIHSSRVGSTTEGFTSSCAVVEEGVPVCQDPIETNKYFHKLSAMQTPFLDNWFDGIRDDRKSTAGGNSRPLGWWWRFISELKRNLEKKDQVSSTKMTAVRSDAFLVPETIVTYSIKGCSPTIVPFDLSACSNLPPDASQHVSTTRVIYYVPPSSRIDRYDQSDFDQ
ncbi:uncharacterized protein LOC132918025 isoform X1 [Rhopalosiphum padi]|uniref:uncharacterized protein LOC132918025 isoform X1 n=2 Tax=Rhopalosiphum padi TaxID=40932 RepID=UPI00298E1907|nr:uncharacterized protein LOC132918025 isoform X1 [Rhopalosiphum padi]